MLKKLIAALFAAIMIITSASADTVELPVFMYHFITKDAYRHGELHISPAEFEKDLAYLADNGYNTVDITDLLDFVYSGVPLPPNPVMLTFDDGYYNNYLHAYPLLQKYGAKAVIFIIGKHTNIWSVNFYPDESHGHMTWEQIREMLDSGLVEFGGHSYNLHVAQNRSSNGRQGVARLPYENIDSYRELFGNDTRLFNEHFRDETGANPVSFAFPFHEACEDATDILTEHGYRVFFTHRGKNARNTIAAGDAESLLDLYRLNRSMQRSVKEMLTVDGS